MFSAIVSAPGKVILHGEHSVVYRKMALASSLSLRTTLKIESKNVQAVELDLPEMNISDCFSQDVLKSLAGHFQGKLEDPQLPSEDISTHLKNIITSDGKTAKEQAIVTLLTMYCSLGKINSEYPGIRVSGKSDLPVGAGLGSSASFCTCLAAGLLLLFRHIQKPSVSSDICPFSKPDLDLINKWAYFGERLIHGSPSGVDNSVATYGGAIRFQHGNIVPVEKMPKLRILLINTKIPRSTKSLVSGVRNRFDKFPDVIDSVLQSMDAVVKCVEEIYKEIIAAGDESNVLFSKLEELTEMNHHLLQSLGVSHPALDNICQTCKQFGQVAKLTGAGGGGCAFCLIHPELEEDKLEKMKQEMQKRNYECWECDLGGPGVMFHHTELFPS